MRVSLIRAASVLCLGVAGAPRLPASPAALSDGQTQWLARASRHEKAGWTYLHIQGGPRERGFQHGYLMAREIAELLRVDRAEWLHESSLDWTWLVASTRGFIQPAIDPEDRAELEGIVEGTEAAGLPVSFDDIVTENALFELSWYWWPIAQRKITGGLDAVQKPKQSCSSFIATGRMTRDGGIVLGHNTWFGYTQAVFNVIVDIVPEKGHRILMQTRPGWIHSGTDFFITDAGLVGSETTIGGFEHYSEKGIPEFVRMRRATQDAGNLDGWCAMMTRGNNGGYANAWLIGDVKTGEIARLELGLQYVGLERTRDGVFFGSNIAENLSILRLETDTNDDDIRQPSVARRVRWRQLMRQDAGKIDVALAQAMLADCYDTCLNIQAPSARTLAGHSELDPSLGAGTPFYPSGAFDGKVVDTAMARRMSFAARWGSADGTAFDAGKFLSEHPQFAWMDGLLKSRPVEPWAEFSSGEGN
jgi:hypothetical protein